MPQSTSSVRTEDDQLIVEAPTAEEALEVVADRLGTRARIAGVERVRRGGVGGFFARELVRVIATGDEAAPHTQRDGAPAEQEPDNALDRLLRQISERDDPFAATLQQKLAPRDPDDGASDNGRPQRAAHDPAHVDPAPASQDDGGTRQHANGPATADAGERPSQRWEAPSATGSSTPRAPSDEPSPAPSEPMALPRMPLPAPPSIPATVAAGRGTGGSMTVPLPGTPRWSVRNLCRLGLPPLLSPDDAARLAPDDDLAWTYAIASSLRPLCRPLPDGPTIFVGPAAERMAGALDLAVEWPGQPTPPESFIAPISDLPTERDWLVSIRGRRHLHLVIGGPGWRGLLFDDPAVLSYTNASMCEAVTLAFQLGIGLGYTCHASGELTRTNPIDLTVAIRHLLPPY